MPCFLEAAEAIRSHALQVVRQTQLVQQQMKRELHLLPSLRGDPLRQCQFHIPLYAAMWGVLRESSIVEHLFKRSYKELLGAEVSRGNLRHFCESNQPGAVSALGAVGMREEWCKSTLVHLPACPKRYQALLLWFRHAMQVLFFHEPHSVRLPLSSPAQNPFSLC
jgi:hypothetical protein